MKKEPVQLSEPLIPQSSDDYGRERRHLQQGLRDGKQGLLAAATSNMGLSYARARALHVKTHSKKRRQAGGGWSWRILMWPFYKLKELEQFKSPVTLPVKAGLAAMIAGCLCFAPGFLSMFNKNGAWAVITADIVLESNVGLTFSKGWNRTVGTLLAALLALVINVVGDHMGAFQKYFLLICTFLGGAIPTIFKFRRPFKDRWNYAVVMAMITFHLLILTQSNHSDKIKLPLLRLALIVFGFVIASIVNVVILPNFAGNNVNNLLATNFERAAHVIERCVLEYCKGTVLQEIPEDVEQVSTDDLHASFHEILAADSEVEKLLVAARCEPPHGKFIYNYPWHLYGSVIEDLRITLFEVVALDSCLRAELQAPMNLRAMFEPEFLALGKACVEVFKSLGKTMHTMKVHDIHHFLDKAEEVAIVLQHNIALSADILLQGAPCPDPPPRDTPYKHTDHDGILIEVLEDRGLASDSSDDDSWGHGQDESEQAGEINRSQPEQNMDTAEDQESKERKINEKAPAREDEAGEVLKRTTSIGDHWQSTVQRLGALSLLKFAAILIEIAAKTKYVVNVVDELADKAHFDKPSHGNSRHSRESS